MQTQEMRILEEQTLTQDERQSTREKIGEPEIIPADQQNNILIGENGDILARYRIPVEKNQVDFALQLPDDSDSSNFSSEEEGEPENPPEQSSPTPKRIEEQKD